MEATQAEAPDATHLQKVVVILQEAFCNETLTNKSTWQMVVLILKGDGGDFWRIGLVEVLWKTVAGLLNLRFTSYIHFHDVLHFFGWAAGRGPPPSRPIYYNSLRTRGRRYSMRYF